MTNPIDYFVSYTGLSSNVLFDSTNGLIGLVADTNNTVTITRWDVPNVTQPTAAQIAAALAPPASNVTTSVLLGYSEIVRSAKANAGITVNVDPSASTPNSVFASTDSSSLPLLSGSLQYVQLNPQSTVHWVTGSGAVELTAAEVTVLATAVFAYIQKTFTVQASVNAAIGAGTITTNAQIDAAFATGMAA